MADINLNKDLNLYYSMNSLDIDLKDDMAIFMSLMNIMETSKGSRFFNRRFGSSLDNFLFEDISANTADNIRLFLFNDITENEPRISLSLFDIDVIPYPDKNSYVVDITFQNIATKRKSNFKTILEAKSND